MKNQFFGILYFLLVIGQMIICNYFQFTPYVVLSMLPAMVLCMPLTVRTSLCMMIAFASGLAVDWLAEGLIGINAASLVPVALARKTIIRVFLGEDLIARNDSFTFKKNGIGKISTAMFVALSIFFACYITLDAAGTCPLSFNLIRFAASTSSSLILSLIVTSVLTPDDRK